MGGRLISHLNSYMLGVELELERTHTKIYLCLFTFSTSILVALQETERKSMKRMVHIQEQRLKVREP